MPAAKFEITRQCKGAPGTQEQIQSFRKDRPYGPEGIHRILRQATGGTSEREHTLCLLYTSFLKLRN